MTDDDAVSTEIQVDDETRAALLLFNERVEASAADERAKKRIRKAERAKDEAAARVRKLTDDPDATAEQRAEAEAAYKEASDNFQVVQANPLAHEQKKSAPKAEEEAPAEEAAPAEPAAEEAAPAEPAAEEAAPSDDAAPTEVSADENSEPAPAASAEAE